MLLLTLMAQVTLQGLGIILRTSDELVEKQMGRKTSS